jgi:RNA polymerase sigma factor for flagellar operon FliA
VNNQKELWQTYAKTKNPAIKDKLIILYAQLVKFVAGRMHIHIGQHVEYDDLIGYGVFGLIDAIDKFDYTKDVKFETYASLRIRGAIIDQIRRMDWVPRTLRQKNKQLETAYNLLEDKHGREPTEEELAEQLGLTIDETRDLIKKSAVLTLVSLDDYLEQNYETPFNGLTANKQDSPEEHSERQERQEMLAEAIEKLTDKEKQVITLYYYEDLTLKEIAGILLVTESRISQIHTKALGKLQGKLGKYKALLFN